MSTPLLAVRGVTTYYGKIIALRGVDLDVNQGEIVTLIGANGAGKSTLMMTICGTPRARDGSIVFDGIDITRMPTHEIMRMAIAQAPEGRRIFPRMTVLENLQMGAAAIGLEHFDEDLERVYAIFPVLKQRATQRGGTLSGGEQQMLAIARALMSRPRLLLLDEPSLGLAPLIVQQIFDVLRDLNRREGLTVFLVEQNAYHALKLAHRGYVMVNGAHHACRAPARNCSRARKCVRPIWRAAATEAAGTTMQGVIFERGIIDFLLVTVLPRRRRRLSHRPGGRARPGGRSATSSLYLFLLACAVRFIHYALFEGTLLSLQYFLVDVVVLLALGGLGFQVTRARQMAGQYSWLYERTGPLSWRLDGGPRRVESASCAGHSSCAPVRGRDSFAVKQGYPPGFQLRWRSHRQLQGSHYT